MYGADVLKLLKPNLRRRTVVDLFVEFSPAIGLLAVIGVMAWAVITILRR